MIFIFPCGINPTVWFVCTPVCEWCDIYANGLVHFENSQSPIYFANEWNEFTCQWWWQSSIFHTIYIFTARKYILSCVDILPWWATYQNAEKNEMWTKTRYHIRINMLEYMWNLYIAILSFIRFFFSLSLYFSFTLDDLQLGMGDTAHSVTTSHGYNLW